MGKGRGARMGKGVDRPTGARPVWISAGPDLVVEVWSHPDKGLHPYRVEEHAQGGLVLGYDADGGLHKFRSWSASQEAATDERETRMQSCCLGGAMAGVVGCTCWAVTYSAWRSEPVQVGEVQTRATRCADCACRKDSPESRGVGDYQNKPAEFSVLVSAGVRFYCHEGMPAQSGHRHEDGRESAMPLPHHNYRPRVRRDGVPTKADGTPADICAGWAQLREQHLQRAAEGEDNGV